MKYGKFLNNGGSIGLNCPSFGINGTPYYQRGLNSIKNLEQLGYKVVSSDNAFKFDFNNILKGVSFQSKAKEFMDQYKDNNIDIIWCGCGGELEINTIEYIDFDELKQCEPKFVLGYSDNTWINFILTTRNDVATVYTYNFTNLGSHQLHFSHKKLLDILGCKSYRQESYNNIELIDLSKEKDPLANMNDVVSSNWKLLSDKNEEFFEGRIIGGCLDVLINIIGSKYDYVDDFNDRYSNEGIIWYFESCDLNLLDQFRAYKHIINSKWLRNVKGILVGRPLNNASMNGIDYKKMLEETLGKLNVPVIYDCDIGHVPPSLTIINGSYNKIKYENKKGTIETLFI